MWCLEDPASSWFPHACHAWQVSSIACKEGKAVWDFVQRTSLLHLAVHVSSCAFTKMQGNHKYGLWAPGPDVCPQRI